MEIIDLIREYTAATAKVASQLKQELGADDLLQGYHGKKYPQHGRLSDGSEYNFHGIGCRFEGAGFWIDWDFGPGGKMGGFDAWRLWEFSRQFPGKYPGLLDLTQIKKAIEMLAQEGLICRSDFKHDDLFYLAR